MAKKSGSRVPSQKGADSYRTRATQTSVDYNPNDSGEKPGASGPHKVKSNAGKGHAPVPGYGKTGITTSCDYNCNDSAEKPGSAGPTLGSKKRAHY